MPKKTYIQLSLILILIVIFLLLFFKYFKQSNLRNDFNIDMEQSTNTSDSLIEDLKYLSTDKEGNKYKIEAKKGNIDQVNPDIYNGATLIGLNGISVKSHGNANPIAFSYALKQCHNFITNDLNKEIIKSIKNI